MEPIRIGIVVGSTRPGRRGRAVAEWVHHVARRPAAEAPARPVAANPTPPPAADPGRRGADRAARP
ncbi:hypothetical protein [Micromonospora sp. DT62]|uniref:hypothetical protein n=1 Tax=Micromonospora sp. DT62 TaxID=3416521 RepID=UPI003CE91A3E